MRKNLHDFKIEVNKTKEDIDMNLVAKIAVAIFKKVGIWASVGIAMIVFGAILLIFPHWFNLAWPWFAVFGGALIGGGFILTLTFGICYYVTNYKLQRAQIEKGQTVKEVVE